MGMNTHTEGGSEMIGIGNENSYHGGTAADAALNQRNQPSQTQTGRPLEMLQPAVVNPPQNRVATPEQVAQTVAHNQGSGDQSSASGSNGQLVDVRA